MIKVMNIAKGQKRSTNKHNEKELQPFSITSENGRNVKECRVLMKPGRIDGKVETMTT